MCSPHFICIKYEKIGINRPKLQRLVTVLECCLGIADHGASPAAIVERLGILRVDPKRLVEVLNGVRKITNFSIELAAPIESGGITWIFPKIFIKILDGLDVLAVRTNFHHRRFGNGLLVRVNGNVELCQLFLRKPRIIASRIFVEEILPGFLRSGLLGKLVLMLLFGYRIAWRGWRWLYARLDRQTLLAKGEILVQRRIIRRILFALACSQDAHPRAVENFLGRHARRPHFVKQLADKQAPVSR
jgi:hypothetical protein